MMKNCFWWFISFQEDEEKDVPLCKELLTTVISCYTSIFRYDTHGFMNRERFQMVVQPIVQQVLCLKTFGLFIYFEILIS